MGPSCISAFLLSQLALAGPRQAAKIGTWPGFAHACAAALVESSSQLSTNAGLLLNNVAALGGEEAIQVLSDSQDLTTGLANLLEHTEDASLLQRLTGVFAHLSKSVASARALHANGVGGILRAVANRHCGGSPEVHEAYVGLANMALANIAVRQEKHAPEVHSTQVPAIKSIVGFLRCALAKKPWSGIYFRVYDVLYALDSLCKCQERDLLGILFTDSLLKHVVPKGLVR